MEALEDTELCFPQFNNSCKKTTRPHLAAALIYAVLSGISLLTVVLNLLVIISISYFRQLHTTTNFLLLSLAVADFLVGLLQMPTEILLFHGCSIQDNSICGMNYFLGFLTVSVSVGSMVLISVDRYLAICDPMFYSTKVTLKKVQLCICPIIVITLLYMRVFVVAVSQAHAMRSHVAVVTLQRSETVKAMKSEMKAARTLGVVVVVFILCFSPYYCLSIVAYNKPVGSSSAPVEFWLLYFNSCLNPVIYVFFYPWFRKSIKHIVTQILQPGHY
ncbi:trace amine-associated receptor 4-like [Lates calcarifer]|uniref:Trace amine-associated receptor 4-like n=1 Tax=Lates calcarifer TaxID=8187 RepID=A0AAJ8B9M9_LATCA|nr:trace amine-associated receptor 4-like [Lates calcarifer]